MLKFASQEKYSIVSCHPHGPKGDMLKYQSSLPKLPVPPLQQSLQKYLKAARPLVNDEEFKKTSKIVEEFGEENGTGKGLQEMLEERAKIQDNWLAEWWLHVAYLSGRSSLVINSSVCGTFTFPFVNDQTFIHYAMKMIVGITKFMLACKSESLKVEKTKAGQYLCMGQYLNITSHCRIPGKVTDSQRSTPIENSHHIIVMHNDHCYSLELLCLSPDGSYTLTPAQHIEEQLHKIVKSSPTKAQHPVGVLTSEHRDTWYSARERLIKDPQNKSNIDKIESAMFMFCLDSPLPGVNPQSSVTAKDLSIASERSLHGNGSPNSSCNRWFDQTNQIGLSPDGYGGCILEHSAADGIAAIQTLLYAINNINSEDLLAYNCPVPYDQLSPAKQLQWNISMETAEEIEAAKLHIDSVVADCDHEVLIFKNFGKEFMKESKLSPDSFIQIAIQLAYYKMYGHLTATYESGTTRLFLHGRTDTIRAASIESLAFCKTMLDPNVNTTEKAIKLKFAIDTHSKCAAEAISGKGFDRHLLGLYILAKMNGGELPSIFTDPTYAKSFHFGLSTSQVYADDSVFCAFGAVTPDGYGICYNPQKEKIIFSITSFKQCPTTDSAKLGTLLFEALQEMQSVIKVMQSLTATKL